MPERMYRSCQEIGPTIFAADDRRVMSIAVQQIPVTSTEPSRP